MESIGEEKPGERKYQGLSLWSFLVVLLVALSVFAFYNPIWTKPSAEAWDKNILMSYFVIPFLVLFALLFEKKLNLISWILNSLMASLVKFTVTIVASYSIWISTGFPISDVSQPNKKAPTKEKAALIPLPTETEKRGSLSGVVTDSAGIPIKDVLVRITKGLDQYSFEVPKDGVLVKDSSSSTVADIVIVRANQKLTFQASSSVLHTMAVSDEDGRLIMNVPRLSGRDETVSFSDCYGITRAKCTVHQSKEHILYIVVVCNPFVVMTDSEGRFSFDSIPAGQIELTAWRPEYDSARQELSIVGRGTTVANVLSLRKPG